MTRRTAEPELALLRQRWSSPSAPRPVVFLGAGGIVENAQLPAYRRAGWPVLGVFDVRREASERLARKFDIQRVFASLEEAIACQDVVFDLAVPAEAVLDVVERLPWVAAVLIQKPLARDLVEAERILAACRRAELTAAVNFQLRFSPNILALREAIERGLLGDITDVEVRVNVHTLASLGFFARHPPTRDSLSLHSLSRFDPLPARRTDVGVLPSGAHSRPARLQRHQLRHAARLRRPLPLRPVAEPRSRLRTASH